MPTREEELIALTRTIEALRTKQRRIKRQLKAVQKDLRAETKHRKGLLQQIEMERAPDVMPSKLTNGATGLKMPPKELPEGHPLRHSSFDPHFEKHEDERVDASARFVEDL